MTLIQEGGSAAAVRPVPEGSAPRGKAEQDLEPFGPGSLLWDRMGLYTAALAGNSAFILQAMHPSIGTVVDQLSGFRTDPVGRARRSFASVQTWVYGGRTAIEDAGPSAFTRLAEAKSGDLVELTGANGGTFQFTVDAVDPQAAPPDYATLLAQRDAERLVLIGWEGDYPPPGGTLVMASGVRQT